MTKHFSNSKVVRYADVPKILTQLDSLKKSGELSRNVKPLFQPSSECGKREIEFTLETTDYAEFIKMGTIFFEPNL